MTLTRHLRAGLALAALVSALTLPREARAVREAGDGWDDDGDGRGIGVQVWSDRGDRAVYRAGDPLSLNVRLSQSAYVAVYDIDTRGRVHLLYPRAPLEERLLAGGRTYRFPRGRDDYYVDGPSGIEYVQVIASPEPLYVRLPWDRDRIDDDRDYRNSFWSDDPDQGDDWMYAVSGDPFVWCSRVNSLILGDDPYGGSGYTSFYVDRRVSYPRYVCNECHVHPIYGSAVVWDPYAYSCPVFDVRISAGWVYRAGYRRTCPPLFVYYRRDNCPSRWASLPRWWSSTDRHRIREYFGPALAQPRALPMPGRTAVDKDNDYRQRSGNGGTQWYAPRRTRVPATQSAPQPSPQGRDNGRSGRGSWKDGDVRSRSGSYRDVDPPSRGEDPSWVAPPEQGTRERRSERSGSNRSWITNLLRGTGPAARGEGRRAPPPEEQAAPQSRERGGDQGRDRGGDRGDRGHGGRNDNGRDNGGGRGNANGKDGDHRSR